MDHTTYTKAAKAQKIPIAATIIREAAYIFVQDHTSKSLEGVANLGTTHDEPVHSVAKKRMTNEEARWGIGHPRGTSVALEDIMRDEARRYHVTNV